MAFTTTTAAATTTATTTAATTTTATTGSRRLNVAGHPKFNGCFGDRSRYADTLTLQIKTNRFIVTKIPIKT